MSLRDALRVYPRDFGKRFPFGPIGGYHSIPIVQAIGLGCRLEHAKELVYADGMDLSHADAAVPVGVTCRLCDRMQCEQRVHPPLHHPLRIDENVRGISFYAPVDASRREQEQKNGLGGQFVG